MDVMGLMGYIFVLRT